MRAQWSFHRVALIEWPDTAQPRGIEVSWDWHQWTVGVFFERWEDLGIYDRKVEDQGWMICFYLGPLSVEVWV